MRWNRLYASTKESLMVKFRRPRSQHSNAYMEEELSRIRSSNISICELYRKSRLNRDYTRHPCSLYLEFLCICAIFLS